MHREAGPPGGCAAAAAALALATSPRLAGAAAQLLGARRVRLYQTALFLKHPGMSDTVWHSGASAAPSRGLGCMHAPRCIGPAFGSA